MTDRINDGGPVFPLENAGTEFRLGMSLRDWFAGQALVGIISKSPYMTGSYFDLAAHMGEVARGAYGYADAMLAAREGGDA